MLCFIRWLCLSTFFLPGQMNFTVYQHPESITVSAGSNITLRCFFTAPEFANLTQVRWYKILNHSEDFQVIEESKLKSVLANRFYFSNDSSNSLQLYLALVGSADSGTYICEVTRWIPSPLIRRSGNGTAVTVTDEDPVDIGSKSFLTEVLLYGALSSVPLIVVALILRCKRAKKRGKNLNPNSDLQEKNSILNKTEEPSVNNVCYAEVAFLKKTRRGENTSTHNKIVPGGLQPEVAETSVKKSEERPEIVYSLITQCKR